MFKSIPIFPDQASTIAGQVDALLLYLVAISVFFSILIAGLVIYFAVKYRRRSENETPRATKQSLALELTWTIIPFLIAMTVFVWGSSVYFTINRPPAGAMDIYGVGKQWMWKFQHATGQREINELHVPVGRAVRLTLASEDVIHSFFVPAFRVKSDVIPGRYRITWFEATKPGKYHLFCAEYCGTKHAGMGGWVYVMEPAEYQVWLSGGTTGGSPVEAGQKLFSDLSCNTCHKETKEGRGPVLAGIVGTEVLMQSGEKVTVDETYIRESILNPQARIVAGYQGIMPTYQGQISEEGLMNLIAYIKSLEPKKDTGATQAGPAQKQTSSEVKSK
ncbi:MAG TPA: cytochrome c oxidase subunit II [Acidobacteriota bacterium]|nr:cytochrome c oxidase subunit II [Acidobacteriota bacterium]